MAARSPMRVADFADLTALADAIASFEHTAVEPEDVALRTPLWASTVTPGRRGDP